MKKVIAAAAVAVACATPAAFAGEGLTGFYVGGNLGMGNPSTTTEDSDCWYECSAYTNRGSGVTFGLKVGQNLTRGNFLYGWDFNYDMGSTSESYSYADFGGPPQMKVTSEFKNVMSLQGKAGVVMQDTALALHFGFASGSFDNEFRDRNATATNADDDTSVSDDSLSGFVYGASVQHSWSDKLILSADLMKFAFETDTTFVYDSAGVNQDYHVRYVNDLDQFRVSVAYKFF